MRVSRKRKISGIGIQVKVVLPNSTQGKLCPTAEGIVHGSNVFHEASLAIGRRRAWRDVITPHILFKPVVKIANGGLAGIHQASTTVENPFVFGHDCPISQCSVENVGAFLCGRWWKRAYEYLKNSHLIKAITIRIAGAIWLKTIEETTAWFVLLKVPRLYHSSNGLFIQMKSRVP